MSRAGLQVSGDSQVEVLLWAEAPGRFPRAGGSAPLEKPRFVAGQSIHGAAFPVASSDRFLQFSGGVVATLKETCLCVCRRHYVGIPGTVKPLGILKRVVSAGGWVGCGRVVLSTLCRKPPLT